MKIDYISHATIGVTTKDAKILFDPWVDGSAYCGQWNVFPKPLNYEKYHDANFVLISHGHEDHMHHHTLENFPNKSNAHIFYPYQWSGGIKEYLQELGFKKITEGITKKKYQITPATSVTYIANALDSVIIVDDGEKVLVNINDSLHSHHKKVIDMFCDEISKIIKRKINYVFCGFGGASWFPNSIHCEGKDDLEIGQVREQMFAHNFCRIIKNLNPEVAVPFAADFALLKNEQRWINTTRFNREHLGRYFKKYFPDNNASIRTMYSGDNILNGELNEESPYRKEFDKDLTLDSLIDIQYAEEIKEQNQMIYIGEKEADDLCARVLENVNARTFLFPLEKLKQANFSLEFSNSKEKQFLNIEFDGNKFVGNRSSVLSKKSVLKIKSRTKIFDYSISSDWGGDAITIGYGADMYFLDKSILTSGVDNVCTHLITRHPIASKTIKKDVMRAFKYFSTNKLMTKLAIERVRYGADKIQISYNRDYWLNKNKCEVCRVCDLPLLSSEFVNEL